jgi:hypothetical protein
MRGVMAKGENEENRAVFKVGHWYRPKMTFKRWESEFIEGELVAFMKYYFRFDREYHVYRFETQENVVKYFGLLEADALDLWQTFFDEVPEDEAPPIREPRNLTYRDKILFDPLPISPPSERTRPSRVKIATALVAVVLLVIVLFLLLT